jgi:2-aminoadipate transaminase
MYSSAKDFRWAARSRNKVSHPAASQENQIKLGGGLGFPPTLPDIISEAVAAAENRSEALQYGPLFGLPDLRDAVARYLSDDGIEATRDNILIVNGAKHGLDLACRVFMEKGDTIIVSAPTYMTALSILRTHEVSFLEVSQDGDGMVVSELEAKLETRRRRGDPLPKLLFDVPDFNNPTGVTLSESRRRRLVELAVKYSFLIVEDDPYRRIRFEGEEVPPIKSFDPEGYVIGLGTVSKILAPGLRIGWVNADVEIVRRMAAQKCDHGTNPFVQRIVAQLLDNGKVDDHIQTLRKILRIHRDTMIAAIKKYLPNVEVATPKGGYFLWLKLPGEMDGQELARHAAGHGVEVFPGQLSFAEGGPKRFLRLAYSFSTPDEITAGIAKLAKAYGELDSMVSVKSALSEMN